MMIPPGMRDGAAQELARRFVENCILLAPEFGLERDLVQPFDPDTPRGRLIVAAFDALLGEMGL